MLYAIFAVFAVVLDQLTKYLTVTNISLGGQVPAIDGLFQFTYVQNTGMAFSMLRGGRWFFLIMTVFAFLLMALAVKKKWVDHPVGFWALTSIFGGAVGNLIDRVRLGYVVDMIEVTFMEFAVFNVADCFVVCGAVLLVIYTLFFDKPQEVSNDSAS